jgi:hypothetical protein
MIIICYDESNCLVISDEVNYLICTNSLDLAQFVDDIIVSLTITGVFAENQPLLYEFET